VVIKEDLEVAVEVIEEAVEVEEVV